jgi:hypothetical protein
MSSDVHAKWMNSSEPCASVARETLPQPILDRLYVVVGAALDLLDALGIAFLEPLDEAVERGRHGARERGQALDRLGGSERAQPRHLDFHPVTDEGGFGEGLP